MTTTHSPGPWWFTATEEEGYYVAGAGDKELTNLISREDARLIAAAPDLLELVEAFASFLRDDSRSERRRAKCLAECESVLARAKVTS